MDAFLEHDCQFADFGRDALMPFTKSVASRVRATETEKLRTAVRQSVPKTPGIYGFVCGDGHLIYVGKSNSLRGRVLSYFLPNHANEKAGEIATTAREVLWEEQPSEFAALLREQKLISRWQPRFNVVGMPRRQRAAYLCLGRGPANCFYVTTKIDPKARAIEGPFNGLTRLTRVAEILNRRFQLRDCSDKNKFAFADQLTLFDDPRRPGCLRVELGTCLGPCAAACSKSAYERRTREAEDFLRGGDVQIVDELELAMRHAAERQQYELAARYREDWQLTRWITQKLLQNEQARAAYNFLYPVIGCDGRDIWYLIRSGRVEHAVQRPTTANRWRKSREEILRWAASESGLAGPYDGGANTLHIVAAWFRKNRDQLKLARPLADLPLEMPVPESLGNRAASA